MVYQYTIYNKIIVEIPTANQVHSNGVYIWQKNFNVRYGGFDRDYCGSDGWCKCGGDGGDNYFAIRIVDKSKQQQQKKY